MSSARAAVAPDAAGGFLSRQAVLGVYLPALCFETGIGAITPMVAVRAGQLGATLGTAGLLAGGRNRALAAHLARHIELPGYQVITDLEAIPSELRGLHPENPVNRVRDGGTQLELSVRVRGLSPRSPLPGRDGWSPVTVALVHSLVAAARSW